MEQNQFKCSGDCLKCHPNQRAYCSSQFTYNTMRMVEELIDAVDELREKVDAMNGSEATVFNPTAEEELVVEPQHAEKE